MKKAMIIEKPGKLTPNGRETIMSLRRGEKGKGAVIHTVIAWPWAGKSMESANAALQSAAERAGVEIVCQFED